MESKDTMFYNAKPHIFEKAKVLRNEMTAAELKLWLHLKKKKMLNLRFRPQHPIDIFIADFYCHALRIVIEVDGSVHKQTEQKKYDIGRSHELERLGIKVIRFTNDEVLNNMEYVLGEIKRMCMIRIEEVGNDNR